LDEDRRSINVFRNLGACLGGGIGAVACLPLLRVFGALGSDGNLTELGGPRGFFIVAIIMGCIVIAGSLTHYFTTKERVTQVSDDEEKMSAGKVAKMLFRCKSWWFNTLYIICYGVINLLLMSCLTYYATYVLGSTASATLIQAGYLITSILTSLVVGTIDRKIGRRKTMMLAAIISILGKIWFIIDPFYIGSVYVNAVSVGAAVAFAFVLFNTNRNNIVDIIEAKEGRRIDSMIASADMLASKLAVAGATQMIAISLAVAGYDANLKVQPTAVVNVINFMLGWAPAIVSVVMLIAAAFITIEKEYAEVHKI
jgi:Na+/melibiose symporter-like transporter